MPYLPPNIINTHIDELFMQAGLPRERIGKVRNIYPCLDDRARVIHCSDRISACDYMTGALIPGQGEALTAISTFQFREVLDGIPNHLLAAGEAIDDYLPLKLRKNPKIRATCGVFEWLPDTRANIEGIVRGYLAGSAAKKYLREGLRQIGDLLLPEGLREGSPLPGLVFDPTTKSDVGHDETISPEEVLRLHGPLIRERCLEVFRRGSDHAIKHGLILVDTKYEFAWRVNSDGSRLLVLVDEAHTHHSSRFWRLFDYMRAFGDGEPIPSLSKDVLRKWMDSMGFDQLDPSNMEHAKQVAETPLPPELIEELTAMPRDFFYDISGMTVQQYQAKLGVYND